MKNLKLEKKLNKVKSYKKKWMDIYTDEMKKVEKALEEAKKDNSKFQNLLREVQKVNRTNETLIAFEANILLLEEMLEEEE